MTHYPQGSTPIYEGLEYSAFARIFMMSQNNLPSERCVTLVRLRGENQNRYTVPSTVPHLIVCHLALGHRSA